MAAWRPSDDATCLQRASAEKPEPPEPEEAGCGWTTPRMVVVDPPRQPGGDRIADEGQECGYRASVERAAECIRLKTGMLRGTPLAQILHRGAEILKDSSGCEATYKLSSPVEEIDVFISHNWSTPRFAKFGALALYFNLGSAVAAMWVVVFLAVPLSVFDVLPLHTFSTTGQVRYSMQTLTSHFLGITVLLLALAFWHEIGRLCCSFSGGMAFLDKTCIHQTDMELKLKGISSLAAFLQHSKRMVVVYSDTYLRKLWTVYELASMLVLNPGGELVVIPCFLPRMVVYSVITFSLMTTAQRLFSLARVHDMMPEAIGSNLVVYTAVITLMTTIPSSWAFMCVSRRWARERSAISRVVREFSIRNAACSDEADRRLVQGNIISFMHALEIVEPTDDPEAMEKMALDAFDGLVHKEVPLALEASFGRTGIPYRYVVIMFVSQFLRVPDHIAPWIRGLETTGYFVATFVENALILLAIFPLSVAALTWISSEHVDRQAGPLLLVWLAVQATAAVCLGLGLWFTVNLLTWWVLDEDAEMWIALLTALSAALLLVTAFVYRPVTNSVQRKALNLNDDSESSLADASQKLWKSLTSSSLLGRVPR